MISGLLKKRKEDPKLNKDLEDLFARPIKTIVEADTDTREYELAEGLEQEEDEQLSAVQVKERNERTVFVGNVDMDIEQKDLKKHFKRFGKIEKIWFRSVPVDKGKLPVKAAVVLKKFATNASGKNAYILFSNKEEAEQALELNGSVIKKNHIRVDLAMRKALDYTKTIFIGNLPFNVNEEEIRGFFKDCGVTDNIRVIRDSKTHIGKGIGYVTFKEESAFKKAVAKNGATFKERELRIKKAVPTERLEKKKQKKLHNAKMRIMKKQIRVPKEDLLKETDMTALLDNEDIKDKDVEDMDLKNVIKTNPGLMKKKIKKIQRKTGQTNALKIALRETARMNKRIDKEIFNGRNEMKIRKEKRAKKAEFNAKKFKKEKLPDK